MITCFRAACLEVRQHGRGWGFLYVAASSHKGDAGALHLHARLFIDDRSMICDLIDSLMIRRRSSSAFGSTSY